MTLAALTPVVTWWPLSIGLVVFIALVICPPIRRRQANPWPPPIVIAAPLPLPPPTVDWEAVKVWMNGDV